MSDQPRLGQSASSLYCVICRLQSQGQGVVRVVGPFTTQQAAVDWAVEMRAANRSWDYAPDVMQPAPEPEQPGPTEADLRRGEELAREHGWE